MGTDRITCTEKLHVPSTVPDQAALTCSRRNELEGTDSGAETDNTAPPKPESTADADSAEVEASLDEARIPPWATCGGL